MTKRTVLLLSLVFLAAAGSRLGAQCAQQDHGTVTFTIHVAAGASVDELRCSWTFSPAAALSAAAYSVASVPTDPCNGSLQTTGPGNERWSDSMDPGVGYHVTLASGSLTIACNPPAATFPSGAGDSWSLEVSGIDGEPPYTITALSVVAYNGGAELINAATVSADPCNHAPAQAQSIGIEYDTAVARRVSLSANLETPPDPDTGDMLSFDWTATRGIGISAHTQGVVVDCPILTSPDQFVASVVVRDQHGAASITRNSTAIDPNDRIVITGITPMNDPSVPLRVSFSASRSPDDDDPLAPSFAWTFTRGATIVATSTDASPVVDFAAPGTYSCQLVMTDARGLPSAVYGPRDVTPNAAPSPGIQGPTDLRLKAFHYYGEAPLLVTLTPTYADDTTVAPHELRWDLDGFPGVDATDISGALQPQTVSLQQPGEVTVTLVAEETDGGLLSAPVSLTIAAYPNEKASFPRALGVPYDTERAPIVDGVLSGRDGTTYGENGWRGAFSAPYSTGTDPDIRVDLVRDGTSLYLGFDIAFDDQLTESDVILVGLGASDESRFTDTGGDVALLRCTPSSQAVQVSVKGPGGWGPFGPAPAGVEFRARNLTTGSHRWPAELRLPVDPGTPWLNLGPRFLFFVGVYQATSTVDTMARYAWPRTIPGEQTPGDLDSPQLDPAWWGIACRDESLASNGLSLPTYASIGIEEVPGQPFTSTLRYKPQNNDIANRLVARVSNDAHRFVDPARPDRPEMLAAEQVRVLFRIANWGVPDADPSYWNPIVASPSQNPTGWSGVPAGVATEVVDPDGPGPQVGGWSIQQGSRDFALDWTLTQAQIDGYTPDLTDPDGVNEKHQCILAEIIVGSNSPGDPSRAVNVVTRSVHRNMNFEAQNDGAPFSHDAEIGARGYEVPTKGAPGCRFLLRLFTRQWAADPRDVRKIEPKLLDRVLALPTHPSAAGPGVPAGPRPPLTGAAARIEALPYLRETLPFIRDAQEPVSFIEYIVKAYLFTGRTIMRGGRSFEEVRPIGSYGYVVHHLGETEDWDFRIAGAERINDTTYILTIPAKSTRSVKDIVRAVEPPRWSVALQGGLSIPEVDPRNSSTTGPCGRLTVELHGGSRFGLRVVAGYDSLGSRGGTAPAWQLASVAGVGVTYVPLARVCRPFLGIGAGGMRGSSGAWAPAGVLGAGMDLALWRALHLRLGADALFSATESTLQVQLGVVYRFMPG